VKKIVVLAVAILFGKFCDAQDFHLTQYDAAPVNFNPAMTGMFNGDYRIHGHYRTQWKAITTKPFTTALVSFDMPIKNGFSAGAQVANFRAGAGNYNVFSTLLSGAYDFAVDKNGSHHISVGVQGGFFQKSINYDQLSYHNQYSWVNGGSFDSNVPSGESFAGNSVFVHDINAGLIYYYGKESSRVNPFIGFSAFHVTQPSESFFSADNKLPMRYLIHGGAKINVTDQIQLLPKALHMKQTNDQEMTASLHMHYYFKDQDTYIIVGPTFRLSGPIFQDIQGLSYEDDAIIAEVGFKYGPFIYRMSYDFNTSSLQPNTNGRGGLEISLTFISRKQEPNPIPSCPRL
jgi:type IX secretion system PorP/SprF family membrane protein